MVVSRFGRVLMCALAVSAWAGHTRAEDAAADQKPKSVVPAIKDPHRFVEFAKDKAELKKKGEIQLVFLGDSITDGWRGGKQHEIFLKTFGKYNPYNTGISGDQTQHLLYRIDHGELDDIHPKVVEIMIGTNNLGNGQSPKDTIEGIKAVVADVEKKLPEAKVFLLAVFPRGEKATDGFRPKIKEVNDALAKLPETDKHVKFLDINEKFLEPDGTLPKSIMPDSLHPNLKGYEIWAEAIGPTVDELEK
ncbi:MAG: putative secreted glycosyl hydrolase [Phycisphaerales bacterium]|nr:putative secreted glycosyl hydrolase [Phycisphaerales bacterium]